MKERPSNLTILVIGKRFDERLNLEVQHFNTLYARDGYEVRSDCGKNIVCCKVKAYLGVAQRCPASEMKEQPVSDPTAI